MPTPLGVALPTKAVAGPLWGVYPNAPSLVNDPRTFSDCLNVRVHEGEVTSQDMGWTEFVATALNGPITMWDRWFLSDGSDILIAGTLTDLYQWDPVGEEFLFITPIYAAGTAAASGTAVTGTLTNWDPAAKAGDFISFGSATENDPAATWYEIASVTNDTALVLTASAGTVVDGPYTIRSVFTAPNLYSYWETENFPRADVEGDGDPIEDTWIATNGVDYPVSWDGSDDQVTLRTDLQFKCKSLRRFKNMLLYLNCTEDGGAQKPFSFKNSDVGRPFTMSGGLAGEFVATPSAEAILVAHPLGDDLAIYTEKNVVMVSFVGEDIKFVVRTAVQRVGALAGRLVALFPDYHEFIHEDGMYQFNGIQATATDMHVWHRMAHLYDLSRIEAGFHAFNEEHAELIWAIPLTSDAATGTVAGPEIAVVAHYLEVMPKNVPVPYTFREFPFTAAGFFQRSDPITWDELTNTWEDQDFVWSSRELSDLFPFVLVGDAEGGSFQLGGDTQNGTAFASFVTFSKRAIGNMRHRNLLRRVYPMAAQLESGSYSLVVTALLYDQEGQVSGNAEIMDFDLTLMGDHFVAPYRRGRFAQVKFGTPGSTTGQPWSLIGYDWDIVAGGAR